jgi:hypothetical protein
MAIFPIIRKLKRINADDGGGMLPNLAAPGGVRLLVRASDATAALALLAEPGSFVEIPEQNESGEDMAWSSKWT